MALVPAAVRNTLNRRRRLAGAVALVACGLIGAAMLLQFVEGLEPCPLCILQRYAFVAVALFALLAAMLPRLPARVAAWLGVLCALAGAGTSSWHVWLQLHPPVISSCGASLEYMVMNLPLANVLPRVFQGYGDCTKIDWTFLGISIPGWSLIWTVVLAAALVRAQSRRD
jgi:disulfide bond formation protein DsbB